MSFLFGKSKNKTAPGSGLPQATRDIASSHGETRIPTANGIGRPGEALAETRRAQLQQSGSNGERGGSNGSIGGGAGGSLDSLRQESVLPGPEPGKMIAAATRQRAESDLSATRSGPTDSPYPWSTRRLNFASNASPFPRYGAAANATASKEGQVYLMGGLVDSQTVKGDLWMVEVGNGSMACYPVNTTSEGPGPRVGHSSLLVGNAFIVFGGDTKLEEGDVLDDTLYLLNISTKQWSRASPAGPRPAGRYGHTLNILGSKIFIFGGQVEGYFFNDLIAFDLNSLQTPGNRWEVMIPNGGTGGPMPKARTNHSVVTWQDKLYLFGGTDGTAWFNDVWTYDARTNQWSELDCIGYIPAPREGHAAALVNDTMYIFGGRLQDGTDLGDLAAFRISSRRWYMFQNMGSSPSARSGHSMTAVGKHIVVLAGEPSSAPRDAAELSHAYVLDTTKIRYPASEGGPGTGNQQANATGPGGSLPLRKFSNDQSRIPQKAPSSAIPMAAGHSFSRPSDRGAQQQAQERQADSPLTNGPAGPPPQSRLPRNAGSGPPPPQAAPQPRGPPGALPGPPGSRSRTPTKNAQSDVARTQMYDRENTVSPASRDGPPDPQSPKSIDRGIMGSAAGVTNVFSQPPSRQGPPSRSGSRTQRQQASLDSTGRSTPRASEELTRTSTRDTLGQVDSGLGSSPSLSQHNDELAKELEAARSRNAWLASELALARKAGYNPTASNNPLLDQQAASVFDDDDRPLIEALLEMKAELQRVQGSIESQAESTASRIAEIEKQRDAAVSEAVYAKAKLAAHGGGSQAGTPQPDARGMSTPDLERNNDMGRRLAGMLTAHNELSGKLESLNAELEAERRARGVVEEGAEAAQRRAQELDLYKQRAASELESLRAELHEAKRVARDESTKSAEALASLRMHELDKNEFANKHAKAVTESKNHATILQTLREAVSASTEKADLLERLVAEERELREQAESKHAQLKNEHESSVGELASTTRKLREVEEMAAKHAEEARTHRAAVLSGLDRVSARDVEEEDINDERVTVLRQQLDIANDMARQHKSAADAAADRLRRAEERIAGLEQYQEQTTRESLALRKQLQAAVKEVQAAHAERALMQQAVERNQLEGNALEVQLRTLKNLLEERGVSTTSDARRSRVLDSPGSRFGTPELSRVRELERQLDDAAKAQDEVRGNFEAREQELNREWEEKLGMLERDQEGAMKYVRGLEKMLAKMKQELHKAKAANVELEKGIKEKSAGDNEEKEEVEALRREMAEHQKSVKTTVSALEAQVATLKTTLGQAERDRDTVRKQATESNAQHEARMTQLADRAEAELESLRRENAQLEARADEAEKKVQLFLDQFESSVDNYRRQSRLAEQQARGPNGVGASGHGHGHGHSHSIGGDSVYSNITDTTETDTSSNSGELTPSAHSFPTAGFAGGVTSSQPQQDKDKSSTTSTSGHGRDRSSTALDSLATELDALRSHWEETSKKSSYRLSDKFEFEKQGGGSPEVGSAGLGSAGLVDWRKKMDLSIRSNEGGEKEDGGKKGTS